ncbi:MAG: HEAT repeat domain-containing protein [Planctomycetes bacterium]|nr:HEAT repeat domain-containing protein [Planctomycetota bacterium]
MLRATAFLALFFFFALAAMADELQDAVRLFESERAKTYAERLPAARKLAAFKDEKARRAVLVLYSHEEDANMRAYLLRLLAPLGGTEVKAALLAALGDGKDAARQLAAAQSIRGRMDPDFTRAAVALLAESSTGQSLATALDHALATADDEESVRWLAGPGLAITDPRALLAVIRTIGKLGAPAAVRPLERLAAGPEGKVRIAALEALSGIDDPGARRILERAMESTDADVAAAGIRGLARHARTDEALATKILRYLDARDDQRRLAAADALGEAGVARALGPLVEMLADPAWQVRAAVIANLRKLRLAEAIDPLLDRLDAEDGRLREDVLAALEDLTGQTFGDSPANWRSWWNAHRDGFVVPPPRQGRPAAPKDGDTISGYYGIVVRSKRVVFVVDISGSMSAAATEKGASGTPPAGGAPAGAKTRMELAKERLEAVLVSFSSQVRFNVIFFDSRLDSWRDALVPATDEDKADAIEFTRKQAPRGGTNIFDALAAAIQTEGVDTVFFLTDGDPSAGQYTDPDDILREIGRLNRTRRVKIHAIALGGARPFLAKLARATGGEYVEP